jgi:hypothetical protein
LAHDDRDHGARGPRVDGRVYRMCTAVSEPSSCQPAPGLGSSGDRVPGHDQKEARNEAHTITTKPGLLRREQRSTGGRGFVSHNATEVWDQPETSTGQTGSAGPESELHTLVR